MIPARPRSASAVALLVAVVTLAACGSSTQAPTASASASPSPSTRPSATTPSETPPTPVPGGSTEASAAASTTTQTDTEWGRIWDALPPLFPHYPGAIPTESASGPVSASLAVGASAGDAATNMQSLLESAGFSTVGRSGPMEDGGFVIDSVGAAGCQVQTRLTPLSGTTAMTILYGAACPFE